MLWSISLCRAKGGFFSVSFGVVGGSTGCEVSDGVCISLSAGFLVFSIGMGMLVLGFGSGGLCVEVTGNGLGGWGSSDLRNRAIGDLLEGPVTKYLEEWLVVYCSDEVVAT